MTWLKLSDDIWRHRKFELLDLECVGLWTLALSKVGADLSDGFISDRSLLKVAGRDVNGQAAQLCQAGLWERVEGGYVFHDYLEYNPSAYDVLTEKEVRRKAASIGGKARSKYAKRSGEGRFTSVTAGQTAGLGASDPASVTPSPVSRIPSPVNPVPASHSAADVSAARAERADGEPLKVKTA